MSFRQGRNQLKPFGIEPMIFSVDWVNKKIFLLNEDFHRLTYCITQS